MKRLPLSDQMPYHFRAPKLSPFWVWSCRPFISRIIRTVQRITEIEFRGLERLQPLLDRGDGIVLAPNHADYADCGVVFELGHKLGKPFYYMAAYQIFTGLYVKIFPRLGVFPVDREGADLRAFKASIEILTTAKNPLVVFPEGEIYRLSDRVTPIRFGTAALAVAALKRLPDTSKTVWIVPIGIKYRYLESQDPLPWLLDLMGELEARFTWWPRSDARLIERIYRYAQAMLALKEIEYLGETRTGSIKERLETLRGHILVAMEDRLIGRPPDESVPVRVKELRRACLERLDRPDITPQQKEQSKRDLNDVFVAIQTFTYPGDYVNDCPTRERIAEILLKFEEDALGVAHSSPRSPRRAILEVGEPIDVRARVAAVDKPKQAVGALTVELQARIQELLDRIGHGPRIDDAASAIVEPAADPCLAPPARI